MNTIVSQLIAESIKPRTAINLIASEKQCSAREAARLLSMDLLRLDRMKLAESVLHIHNLDERNAHPVPSSFDRPVSTLARLAPRVHYVLKDD